MFIIDVYKRQVSAPPILKTLKTKDMIAKTILQQIGGKRFTAMTGRRDFIDMGNGLRMSLARNKTSANRLDIIYAEGADLYNMRFYRRTFKMCIRDRPFSPAMR